MLESLSPSLTVLLFLLSSAPVQAQHKPETIERGKKATALVAGETAKGGASDSAFCIQAQVRVHQNGA